MGFSEIFAIFAQKSSHISSQYFVIFQDSSKNEEEANNYGEISGGGGVTRYFCAEKRPYFSSYFVAIFQDSSMNEEESNNYGDISVGEGVTPVSRYISM